MPPDEHGQTPFISRLDNLPPHAQPTSGDALGGIPIRLLANVSACEDGRSTFIAEWSDRATHQAIPQVRAATLEAVVVAAMAYVDNWPYSNIHGPRRLANTLDALAALDSEKASS